MTQPVAFLGIGNMGTPMAMNLLRHKIPLFVYNRTPEKADILVKGGAKLLNSPAEAFNNASIVITMVSNDQALEELTEGLLQSIKPGCIHISMSTVSPETVRKLEKLHQDKRAHLVSAPVFGRPEAAAAKKLWICLSGPFEARSVVKPILNLLGQRLDDFGDEVGSANVVKLIGNFLILSAIESLGEAISLGQKNNIPADKLIGFFTETLFPSPVYQNYGKVIGANKFEPAGFKLALGLKDLTLVQQVAETSSVTMPVMNLLRDLLLDGSNKGRGEMDWAAITLSAKK